MFDYIEAEKQESEEQKPKMKMKNCEKREDAILHEE
jgi:hypothetical protein